MLENHPLGGVVRVLIALLEHMEAWANFALIAVLVAMHLVPLRVRVMPVPPASIQAPPLDPPLALHSARLEDTPTSTPTVVMFV